MNTASNFFYSVISVFLLSLPLKAVHVSHATYREKVLSELLDKSSKFPKSINKEIEEAHSFFDCLINESEQNKEIFSKAKIFLNTGNISCVINYLNKKTPERLSNDERYQKLITTLKNLEKHSNLLNLYVEHLISPIIFKTLIPRNEVTHIDAKNMIAAQMQSKEPCINAPEYVCQSPFALKFFSLRYSLLNDDVLFPPPALKNTNPSERSLKPTINIEELMQEKIDEINSNKSNDKNTQKVEDDLFNMICLALDPEVEVSSTALDADSSTEGRYCVNPIISEDNLQEEIKKIAYSKSGNDYILNHALYVIHRTINPEKSIEKLFDFIRKGATPSSIIEQGYTAQEWLSDILSSNISEAEQRYPEAMIINQEDLELKIAVQLISILMQNNKELAYIFYKNGWHEAVINIPLSPYHAREKYSLQLNFSRILAKFSLINSSPVVQPGPQASLRTLNQEAGEAPAVRSGKVEFIISEFDSIKRELKNTSFALEIQNIPHTTSRKDFIQHILSFFIAEKQKVTGVNVYQNEKKCTASPYVKGKIPDDLSKFLYNALTIGYFQEFLNTVHFTDDNNTIIDWENISQIDAHSFSQKIQYFIPRTLTIKYFKNKIILRDAALLFHPSGFDLYETLQLTVKPFIIERIFSMDENCKLHDITEEIQKNNLEKLPLSQNTKVSYGMEITVIDP